jgi:nucleotide-binding universal stress UspA family protein
MSPNKTFEGQQSEEVIEEAEKFSIDRILCPVDFSEFSRTALRYAISLARHFSAQLYVQHAAQIPQGLLLAEGEPGAVQDWRSRLPRFEQDIANFLRENGVDTSEVKVLISEGAALDRILETISTQQIDLLVMGTHGRKGIRRVMVGSVAEEAIHQAPCPVLVISHPEKEFAFPEEPDAVRLKTIVLATDFSVHSNRAVDYALSWACEWAAKVVVFHAVSKLPETGGMLDLFPEYNPFFEKQVSSAWQRVRHLVPESVERWSEVTYEIRHGNAKEEILKVAEEKNADLIIIGARGAGMSIGPWGSVSSAVVREGRFPVLVVREARG